MEISRLHNILDTVLAYDPDADLDMIRRAYVFSARAHQGQTRRSGEPYLTHPVGVAAILAEMKLDVASIVAGMLHDTVEDTLTSLEEIEKYFGSEIRDLVDGVTKLGKIQFTTSEERQAENFRKMIMAMAKDIRVILVKLADRVHNMRTMEFMPEDKQDRIARETIEIYAPIANRLGIQRMKIELEDLSLKYLKPEVYQQIDAELRHKDSEREKYIKEVMKQVRSKMHEYKVEAELIGRVKHYYSIHRKMEAQNITFEEVHDIIAFRMIVEAVPQCYEALGLLHSMWKPIPGRFKDYIAMPKGNNYQSLHTTVIGPFGERVEFQIRTREMHLVAENGIAAHWKYKEKDRIKDADERKFKWIRQLLEWQSELSDPAEFLDTVKLDLFADDVYVFTPRGELRELPRGATPIDFAYDIHTEVGNSCVGAKVNGKIVPLRYELRSGDTVVIITQKNRVPNKDWLQFVKTSRAKAKIRQYVRSQERDHGIAVGTELFEKECKHYGENFNNVIKEPKLLEFANKKGYKDVDSLLAAIGYGKFSSQNVLEYVFPSEKRKDRKQSAISKVADVVKKITRRKKGLVRIDGFDDFLVNFGKCCNPIPGDSIVGYVTRGRGVSVHVVDCQKIMEKDPDRKVAVQWDMGRGGHRVVKLKVVCIDRPGMLISMTEAITNHGVNISRASVGNKEGSRVVNFFELEIGDVAQLRKILKSLEGVKGIVSVMRVRS
jgi:GTP pyrophosphokinase